MSFLMCCSSVTRKAMLERGRVRRRHPNEVLVDLCATFRTSSKMTSSFFIQKNARVVFGKTRANFQAETTASDDVVHDMKKIPPSDGDRQLWSTTSAGSIQNMAYIPSHHPPYDRPLLTSCFVRSECCRRKIHVYNQGRCGYCK